MRGLTVHFYLRAEIKGTENQRHFANLDSFLISLPLSPAKTHRRASHGASLLVSHVHFPASDSDGALRNGSVEIAGVRVEGRKGGCWFGKKRFFLWGILGEAGWSKCQREVSAGHGISQLKAGYGVMVMVSRWGTAALPRGA